MTSYWQNKKRSHEDKQKMRDAKLLNPVRYWLGKKRSQETAEKIRATKKGSIPWNKGIKTGLPSPMLGKKHSEETRKKISMILLKKNNRTTPLQKEQRNDPAYKSWRKSVWLRDNFKCKIANPDCKGRIEAHHILGWKDHLKLRYETNNGITLCHAHHPRKRNEEAKLSPFFQSLVAEMK